jgi:hypothetical protein
VWKTDEEKKHGRAEQREIRSVTGIGWLEGKGEWKDLKTVIQYRSLRNGTMTGPKKRFVASLNPDYMFTVFFGK